MSDWSEGKKYGPSYEALTREQLLGDGKGVNQILDSLRLPGISAARRLNAAKEAVKRHEDPPEDIVPAILRALEDSEKADIGEGNWLSGKSELLQQVYEYFDDLRAHHLKLKSEKDKDEKKA